MANAAQCLKPFYCICFILFRLCEESSGTLTFSSPLISTLIWSRIAPDTLDLSDLFSRLYHTSISPDNVRTSMMVCPKKSSDSRVNFCLSFDFRSLSSSHTRTLILSDELWHSLELKKAIVIECPFLRECTIPWSSIIGKRR